MIVFFLDLEVFQMKFALSAKRGFLDSELPKGFLTSRRFLFLTLNFNDFDLAMWSVFRSKPED